MLKEEKEMNKLLIEIAKRLVCKAIKVNTDDYNIQVAYKFINNKSAIVVTLFDKDRDNVTFWFYDDDNYSDIYRISQFREILKKIRKREL